MKQAHLFLCLIAAVVLTACQKKDDPVVDDTPPDNPQPTVPQQELKTDEVDPSVYKYPGEGDFMNPNLIIPDYDKLTLTAIDTLAYTATLDFAGEVPTFYRGCVIVPMKDGEAYPMFVKKAVVNGSSVRLDWRPAAIGEVFFNTSIGTATETKAGDSKGALGVVLGALKHFDAGFIFNFKGVNLDLDADVEVEIGKPVVQKGTSINAPVKKMKAVFTGTVTTGAEVGLEVKGQAKAEYNKALKESIFHKGIVLMCYAVPVPLDFDVDLMAQLAVEVSGAVKHVRDYTYKATVRFGGTMDFETGVFTPVHSFNSNLTKGDPKMEWGGEVHASVVGCIYPRIRTYLFKFKNAAIRTDLKPIVGQINLHGKYKDGKFLHGYELIVRSELNLNAYYQEILHPENIHDYMLNDFHLEWEWSRIKQPAKLLAAEEDKPLRGSFNTTSSLSVQVRSEEDGQTVAPYPDEPFWIEAQPQSTLPPVTKSPRVVRPRADGWYPYEPVYFEMDEEGNADMPVNVPVPAGCGLRYDFRLLDGQEETIDSFSRDVETAVKEYKIKHTIDTDDAILYPICTAQDYGEYLQEKVDLGEGVVNTATWDHGTLSATMYVPGFGDVSAPGVFMGPGNWLARNQHGATGGGKWCSQLEAFDYAWWANENGLGNSLEGAHFVKEDYHGLPCTKMFSAETGTMIYYTNILLFLKADGMEMRTTSLEGVDGWYYQQEY